MKGALEAVEDRLALVPVLESSGLEDIVGYTGIPAARTHGAEEAGGDAAKEQARLLDGVSGVGWLGGISDWVSRLGNLKAHLAVHWVASSQELVVI